MQVKLFVPDETAVRFPAAVRSRAFTLRSRAFTLRSRAATGPSLCAPGRSLSHVAAAFLLVHVARRLPQRAHRDMRQCEDRVRARMIFLRQNS